MAVTTSHHSIVIIGGGSAGISVASRLQHKGFNDIGLIDPASMHYYQPLWTLVGGGRAPAAEPGRAEADLIPKKAAGASNPVAATTCSCLRRYSRSFGTSQPSKSTLYETDFPDTTTTHGPRRGSSRCPA